MNNLELIQQIFNNAEPSELLESLKQLVIRHPELHADLIQAYRAAGDDGKLPGES